MKALINEKRLLDTFFQLVSISSPSFQEEHVFDYCREKLKALGFCVEMVTYSRGENLFAVLEGNSQIHTTLLLSAHADTVTPCENIIPALEAGVIRSTTDTILGADNKAAISIFLETMEVLGENNLPHGRIEILISSAEETGLCGAMEFDYTRIEARHCLIFDASGHPGLVINEAPGHTRFAVTVQGKTAHAGIEPEKGVNAICAASWIISRTAVGRLDRESVANWGIIQGGNAGNIIPDRVFLEGEVRSHKTNGREGFLKKLAETIRKADRKFKTVSELSIINSYGPFSAPAGSALAVLVSRACTRCGLTFETKRAGGCSDANIIHGKGIACLNLACGMQQVHTTEEYITLKDLQDSCRLLLDILTQGLEHIPGEA